MNVNDTLLQLATQHFDTEKELPWLQKKLATFSNAFKARSFYLAFSACPRFISKDTIELTAEQAETMRSIFPNFDAISWTKDEIARISLMTAIPTDSNHEILEKLFDTADYRELIALYKGLYFLENASAFTARAREGLRTNMVGVFDAIALENPFPFEYLSEDGWNQMVLKAMFMDRPMYRIYKIEERKNAKLAHIFLDYAHERWSAHRKVSPELWRFVSGFVNDDFFKDIKKTIQEGDELERLAATKALAESDYSKGQNWLSEQKIETDNLPTWEELGQQLEAEKMAQAES